MKLGTKVKLPDGRIGTVVFNSLIGVGIKWGVHDPPLEDFDGTTGGVLWEDAKPADWPWRPDALLRKPWLGALRYGFAIEDCVGEEFEVLAAAKAKE
jgi:hypothetical protein